MAGLDAVNPLSIQEAQKGSTGKSARVGKDADFGAFLGAAEAFAPTATTAGQMYGDPNSSAVLGAAFSGVTSLRQQTGGVGAGYAVPSYSTGGFGGDANLVTMGGGYNKGSYLADPNAPLVPGAEGYTNADLMSNLQQSSMHLLETQALLQNHMQESNIKSNILSAKHRADMSMIEKFTARG